MQGMASNDATTGPPSSQGLGKLLVPGLIVLIVVIYAVSLIMMKMTAPTTPADMDHQLLTRPVIGWAALGMFDTILLFPTGLLAAMKLGPKKRK